MECEKCGGDSTVKDSRKSGESKIRRRRICLVCGERWTTEEKKVAKVGGCAHDQQRNRLLGPVYVADVQRTS